MAATSGFSAIDKPEYADYSRCVHCGLCLNHCPTYRLWHQEADSPRGRIRQMLLVDEGRMALGDSFVTHIDRCLDCRACERRVPRASNTASWWKLARAQIAAELPAPVGFARGPRFCLSAAASLPWAHRCSPRECCALSAFGAGCARARDRHLEAARA